MKYVPPIGGAPTDPYVNENPATGVDGSPVDAAAIEHPMRELDHLISMAGLSPDTADLTQVFQAVQALIAVGIASLTLKQKSLIATAQTFAPGVANGDPVRWDSANTRWAKALADGTANDLGLGLADVTNAEVVLYGETRAGLVSGLTPGAAYYLSAAGALSTTAATDIVRYGVAKSATVLYIDIDSGASLAGLAYLANANVWAKQQSSAAAVLTDAATIAWDVATRQVATVSISTSRTLGLATNQVANTYYSLEVTVGAGGAALAFAAGYKGVSGITPSTTNGAVNHYVFKSDGTNMRLVSWRANVGA